MSLAAKIAKRNQHAIDETVNILSDYSVVFDEVFKDMCHDEMTAEWINVDFHRNNNALIDLIGAAKYREGTIMRGENEDVVYIDASNVNNYVTHMRVILPLMLVDDADFDGLVKFVKEYSDLVLSSSQEEMDLMVADDAFLKKYFECFKDGVKIPTPKSTPKENQPKKIEYEGFDLTDMDLDEDQIKQLMLLRPEGKS
jgi:hypothetical protein